MSLTADVGAALRALVPPRAEAAAAAWFDRAWAEADSIPQRERFFTLFAGAGRRLGRAPLLPDAAESQRLAAAGLAPSPAGWGLDECGRGALLLKVLEPMQGTDRRGLAAEVYHRGEVRERQALLRVLAYLPDPQGFRELAVEACRTSVESVFRAMACDNPYPAAHFEEASFNQMVLKAVFVGAPLDRVHDLSRRMNPDLVRMAEDYAAERRAAGRAVPKDLDLIFAGAGTRSA